MKKRTKIIIIITLVIFYSIVGIYLKRSIDNPKVNELILEQIGGHSASWSFDADELSEDDFELYKKLLHEGFSYGETIKIVAPDKYEELEKIPIALQLYNNKYLGNEVTPELELDSKSDPSDNK